VNNDNYVSTGSGAWTEPGAYPVADGVYRIPLPLPMDGLRAVNVYVMETDDGLVLVDGGWAIPVSRDLFEKGLKKLGYGIGDKASMDLMHDENLSGDPNLSRLEAAGALELAEGWRAMMPKGRRPSMDDYGMPDEWLDRDLTLDLGGRRVDAVATPGHTQGHYVFADAEQGLLFAGDHVLPTITPSIGFEPVLSPDPLGDFLRSLAVVRSRPDAMLLPAHGPVTSSVHARVDELVAHHGTRLDETEAAVRDGATNAFEAAHRLRWTRRERELADLDPFNQMLAIAETGAHLQLLAAQGRLTVAEDGPPRRFVT
jgi:glyoxylase-like metal-dependent hydrolase (beta-lactamase superfamily II)